MRGLYKSVLSSFQMCILELSPAVCLRQPPAPEQVFVYLASDPLLAKRKEKQNELELRKAI